MNGSANMQQSRTAMIIMFVVAVGMLIGAISIFTKAWNQSVENAELRAKNPTPPPPSLPGEKPKEPEPPKPASLGEAFSIASAKPWFWWTLLNTVVLGGLGLFYLTRKPVATLPSEQEAEDRQWGKLGYFAMLSLVGFFTVVSLAIPYTWINSSELLNRQGWSTMQPWLIVLAYVLGLGSMFGSLLAIKSEERSNAALRRWIYGYNAFLGALLFLSILGVLNAWFALYGPEPSDWTEANIYSISPATKRLMKSLEKPVHAYVMLEDGYLLNDVLNTLNNSKKLTSHLEVTEIPLIQKNIKEIEGLLKKYNVLSMTAGILLVQDPNSDKPLSTFIKQEDLEEISGGVSGISAGKRYFKGETAIYSALREFRQEKKLITIYFTQDSGELSIDEAAARGPRNNVQVSRSILNVKRRLEKAGYIVKPLNLGEQSLGSKEASKVPEDALAVIIADPLRMTPEKAASLDAYLKRPKAEGVEPGKLIAFFDPHFANDGKVLPTGLEGVLGSYGVQVGQDILYSVFNREADRDPTITLVTAIPQLSDPEIQDSVEALITNSTSKVELRECRSIKPIPANISYDVKALLFAITPMALQGPGGPRVVVWSETVNRPKPIEYVQGLLKSNELLKKDFPQLPPSLAVTVRNKGQQQPPQNPMMQPPPAKLGEPRMVVFGDATFLTDTEVQATADLGSNMLLNCLAWVRGKPELDSGDVTPRERRAYRLTIDGDTFTRLIWLPPVWLLLSVIMAGVGVAILRRQ